MVKIGQLIGGGFPVLRAGAGYDIGASAAQASTQTFGTPYVSNVVFSGARLEGGNASLTQRDSADATATSKSPGAVTSQPNVDGALGSPIAPSGQALPTPPNYALYALIGVGVLILLRD